MQGDAYLPGYMLLIILEKSRVEVCPIHMAAPSVVEAATASVVKGGIMRRRSALSSSNSKDRNGCSILRRAAVDGMVIRSKQMEAFPLPSRLKGEARFAATHEN